MALNPNGFAQGFQSGFGTMDDYYTRKEQQRLGRLQEERSASKHEMEKKLFDQQTARNAHDLRKLEDEKIKERSNVLINQITGTIQTGKVPSQELFTEFHELTGVDLWDSVNEEFMTASTTLRDGTHQINSPEYLNAVNTVMNKVLNQHNDGQPFKSQGRVRFDGEMGASYGDVVPIDGRKIIDRKVVNIRAMPGGRYGADVEVTYIDHKGVQRTYLAPMTDAGHTADRGLDVVGKDANAVQSFFLGQDMLLRGMAPMLEGMSRYKQSNDMLPTLHESTKVKIAIHQEKAKAYNLEAAQFLKANASDDSDGALLQALAMTGNENALRALASQSEGGITDEVLDQYKRIKARANNEYELAMNLASGSDAVLQALQAAATPTNEGRGYGVGKTDTYLRDVPGGVKSWLIQPESVLDQLNKTAVQVNKPTGGLPNNTTANPSPEPPRLDEIVEPARTPTQIADGGLNSYIRPEEPSMHQSTSRPRALALDVGFGDLGHSAHKDPKQLQELVDRAVTENLVLPQARGGNIPEGFTDKHVEHIYRDPKRFQQGNPEWLAYLVESDYHNAPERLIYNLLKPRVGRKAGAQLMLSHLKRALSDQEYLNLQEQIQFWLAPENRRKLAQQFDKF